MSDYIRREDALKEIDEWIMAFEDAVHKQSQADARLIRKGIVNLPPADVVQVVHAKWENYSPITIKCSRCGHVIHDWRYSECKYCPNCGAKMDARGEE